MRTRVLAALETNVACSNGLLRSFEVSKSPFVRHRSISEASPHERTYKVLVYPTKDAQCAVWSSPINPDIPS
jgi:hypothetical protein